MNQPLLPRLFSPIRFAPFRALRLPSRRSAPLLLSLLLLVATSVFRAPAAWAADAIKNDDILTVNVSGEPALSKNYTVNAQGDITLSMLGAVHVAGLTPQQAQERITQGLKRYLKLFEVEVIPAGDTGGSVLVYGEVGKPGAVKLESNSRLLDVLAAAGQPTANADTKRISIARKNGGEPETVDLDAVLKDRSLNVPVHVGDTVTVLPKGDNTIEVMGEVRLPGSKSLDTLKTVYAAIVNAGPTENADWSRILIRHKATSVPLTVDLTSVRSGQQKDDLELLAGDQVTVPSQFLGAAILRGEVKTPGEKPINGRMQLLDFITTSGGGFGDHADMTNVKIMRKEQEPKVFNLEEVLNGSRSSDDPEMAIRPGDVVFVSSDASRRFGISGGVVKPGTYPAQPGMRLMDAVTKAEGFTPSATHKQFVVLPQDPQDERIAADKSQARVVNKGKDAPPQTMILIDYKKLLKGDSTQNITIKPGDNILIPVEPSTGPKPSVLDQVLRMLPLITLLP